MISQNDFHMDRAGIYMLRFSQSYVADQPLFALYISVVGAPGALDALFHKADVYRAVLILVVQTST
jgi:hypothetical protein